MKTMQTTVTAVKLSTYRAPNARGGRRTVTWLLNLECGHSVEHEVRERGADYGDDEAPYRVKCKACLAAQAVAA